MKYTHLPLFVLAFLMGLLPFHLSAQQGYVMEVDTFNYQITFPQEPTANNLTVPSPIGELDMNMYLYEAGPGAPDGNLVYLVNFTQYPQEAMDWGSETEQQLVFRGAVDGMVANVNGELMLEEEIEFRGFPGREVQVGVAEGAVLLNVRIYLVDNNMYMIQVASSSDAYPNEQADGFLDSFDFLDADRKLEAGEKRPRNPQTEDFEFRITFPGTMGFESFSEEEYEEEGVRTIFFHQRDDETAFFVAFGSAYVGKYAGLREKSKVDQDALMEARINEVVEELDGEITLMEDITFKGLPGKTFTILANDDELGMGRMLMGKNYLYMMLGGFGPGDTVPQEFVDFLDSFEPLSAKEDE